jgi:hypothetical protein
MKNQLIFTIFFIFLFSFLLLTGCLGDVDNTASDAEKLVGTWGETTFHPYSGEIIIGDVSFYKNGTGTASSSETFPAIFNYSISNGIITVIQPGKEDSQVEYEYFFTEEYKTLNIKNSFGGTISTFKKQ